MITFFTTTHKITDPFLNSLESWNRLECVSEVFVFSDNLTQSDLSQYSGKAKVFPSHEQERPPLVKNLFTDVFENSNNDFFCYLNSDILLLSDFCNSFKECTLKFENFQMIGRRWNWQDDGWKRFSATVTDREILETVQSGAHELHPHTGVDYFCFNREVHEKQIDNMPDFYIARRRFDHYLSYCPRNVGAEVVDCSNKIYCIHHDESREVRTNDWNSKPNFYKECAYNENLYRQCCSRDNFFVNGIVDARTCEL